MHPTLEELGLSPRWEALFAPHASDGVVLARVVRGDRGSALVASERGVLRAKPATRLLKQAAGVAELPAVGYWVALFVPPDLDVPLVEAVLERASAITRGESGRSADLQVLAANVDTVLDLTIAFDVLWIDYSGVKSIANPLLPNLFQARLRTDGGAGFGWEDMTVYKLEVQYAVSPALTLRGGYTETNWLEAQILRPTRPRWTPRAWDARS